MAHFRAFYCMSMRMGESDQKPDKPCFYELNRGNGQEWIIPTKSRALHLGFAQTSASAHGSRTSSHPPPRSSLFASRKHGQEWIRTTEGVSQRIYSPPRLATSVPTRRSVSQRTPLSYWAGTSAKRGWMVIDFITIFANGKSLVSAGWLLMESSTSNPSRTSPKTVYLPSSFGNGVRQT